MFDHTMCFEQPLLEDFKLSVYFVLYTPLSVNLDRAIVRASVDGLHLITERG